MPQKIKNAIIFLSIAAIIALAYIFLIKKSPQATEETNLISSSSAGEPPSLATVPSPDKDFLPLLLNVKNIRLNDAIFSDPAFMALIDSSIILLPEGNEGRPNPFAPLGSESSLSSKSAKPN